MADSYVAFEGDVPANYDRYLGPFLFAGFADDLASRVEMAPGCRVLEVACGTGIVTARLLARLPETGRLVATDLNEDMVSYARAKIAADPRLEWRAADALDLPFAAESFDVVVFQFGLMFFPDKLAGLGEARRVLRSAGQVVFNVWDAMEHNRAVGITHDTIASFFPDDPPMFYTVPYGFHDRTHIGSLLIEAGFTAVESQYVELTASSPAAADLAVGFVRGNPTHAEVNRRNAELVPAIEDAVAAALARDLGDHPVQCRLRALAYSGRAG